jgi:hypothetical protein
MQVQGGIEAGEDLGLMQMNAKRQLMPCIRFAVVLMGIGSTVANGADIAGKWDSDRGPATITRQPDGRYLVAFAQVEGTVAGSLDGEVFQGTWVRKQASQRCQSEKAGSPYWGGFKVTFYTPEIFQGWWYPCTDELVDGMAVESWSGARAK